MDQTLKSHEKMIENHEYKLSDIQQDLIDVKVRLGIKDKTNGQVVEYHQKLVESQELERAERKEHDAMIMARIDRIDERIWYLAVGVGLTFLLGIGSFIIQTHL